MASFSVQPVLSKGGTIGPHKVMQPEQKGKSTAGFLDLLDEEILTDKVGTQVYCYNFYYNFRGLTSL